MTATSGTDTPTGIEVSLTIFKVMAKQQEEKTKSLCMDLETFLHDLLGHGMMNQIKIQKDKSLDWSANTGHDFLIEI